MSTKEQIIKKLAAAEAKRENLFKKRKPIDTEIELNYEQIKKLKDKLTKIEISEPKSLDEKIEYFIFEDGSINGTRYNERTKFWNEFCGLFGLYVSGYRSHIKQVNFQIKLTYGSEESLSAHIEQIKKLLPFIKSDEEGYKNFSIFEYTLSRNCSFHFRINENASEYIIVSGRWSEIEFKTLKEALIYIQKNHWYDGKDEEDYD